MKQITIPMEPEKNVKPQKLEQFTFNGQIIRASDELICLTDLWRAAGSEHLKKPIWWFRQIETIEFIFEVIQKEKGGQRPPFSQRPEKDSKYNERREWFAKGVQYATDNGIVKITKGRDGATFAHWQIALAYAKYLSPELHMHVNEIYMRYRSGDVTLADEIADKATPEEQEWLAKRVIGKIHRKQFAESLCNHEVRGAGFPRCTNSIYKPTLGGTAKELKKLRNLPANASLRDHLDAEELSIIAFAEIASRRKIEKEDVRGNIPCERACFETANKVAELL